MKKNKDKLIEMQPGLWLDTQNSQVIFDSKWLRDTFSERWGREPTDAEMDKLRDGYKSTRGFACVRDGEVAR